MKRALLPLLALAACTPPQTPPGRFLGQLTPTRPGPFCAPSRGSLLLRDGQVTFTPDEGVWVLSGTALSNGTLEADRETVGKQAYATHLEARWTELEVTGTYTTPRCTYAVALQRR